jgi:capsular exopolysaccharide synthesis family protein
MSERNNILYEEEAVDLRKEVLRFLAYWPWFMVCLLLSLGGTLVYLKYAPNIFVSTAKVKIINDKETQDFSLDISKLLYRSNVNLANEIEAFKSYRLLEQVVKKLDTYITYEEVGTLYSKIAYVPPFRVHLVDDMQPLEEEMQFSVVVTNQGFDVFVDSELTIQLSGHQEQLFTLFDMPLRINLTDTTGDTSRNGSEYLVRVKPIIEATQALSEALNISMAEKDSDVLQLQIESTNKVYAQEVLNSLITAYANDVVLDRQQVSIRTIEFVDDRFLFLGSELDSIERYKKNFKQINSLSFIEGDVQANIEQRTTESNELKSIETQLLLAQLLDEALAEQTDKRLLPANLGLNNVGVNQLVNQYNELFLAFEKMGASAGVNNPNYRLMATELESIRKNINSSMQSYVGQLKDSRNAAQFRQERAVGAIKEIPEKEQILRSIERQQNLKESLYLLLLQKREEAAINLAITVPNIKVIDHAITQPTPIAPKRKIIVLGALIVGLILPFTVLYIRFSLDTKINDREDIEKMKLSIPLLGEIPFVAHKNLISDAQDRSVISESFRIVGSNINYKLGQHHMKKAKVIFVTSAMKGEGKSFTATNLALSYAYLNKRVLLLGADLRNPQIHKYFNLNKGEKGLADYLATPDGNWKDFLTAPVADAPNFDVMLSGSLSLNPAVLLANEQFAVLIAALVGHYDYIVVDTAPTLLVSDTHMIANNADLTLHVLRAGITNKAILEYAKGINQEKKLKNMTFILNAVGKKSTYGYGYGYGYGYNYGYGYGYGATKKKRGPWYRGIGPIFGKK